MLFAAMALSYKGGGEHQYVAARLSGDLTSCFRPHDAREPKLDFLDRGVLIILAGAARRKFSHMSAMGIA
jgi:hypothetical protein